MKIFSLTGLILTAAILHAESPKATITEQTKLEVIRGKGSIVLKAGTAVEVVSKDGDNLGVVYRGVTGFVPAGKTDFKGEVPVGTPALAKPEGISKSGSEAKPAPAVKVQPKPVGEPKPVAVEKRGDPVTDYGKMVKKAQDNEAKHKENLVDPVNEVLDSKKN